MENDGLHVRKLKVNEQAIKKLEKETRNVGGKRKIRWERVIIPVAAIGVVIALLFGPKYEITKHKNDYVVDGMINHTHVLDKKTYVSDFKFVNEDATYKDVLEDIEDGGYKYYRDHNGKIEEIPHLQNEEGKDNIEFYNEVAVEFAEGFLEEYEEMAMSDQVNKDK